MNHENIVSEFNRGLKSLQAAQILMKEDLYEDAVSRGYYAVMHAAKAALFYHNTLAESHAALRRLYVPHAGGDEPDKTSIITAMITCSPRRWG